MEIKSRREEFERQGYIFCKDFFSKDEIDNLWENIKLSDIEENTFRWDQNRLQFHTHFLNRNHKIRDLIAQSKVVDLLSQIVGANIWVRFDQAISKDPGASMMPWHQDNGYTRLKHTYYQVWIPLTKMTLENGGLLVQSDNYSANQKILPHKYVDGFFVCEKPPNKSLFIEAKPGDIAIFSSLLLHCTTPNTSNESRWSYVVECLPLNCFDPLVEPPYFVMARDGKPYSKFVRFFPQRLNPINVLKYGWFKLKNVWYCWLRPVVRHILKIQS
ncbi:phytanoyl-CoA dioxygenase family protein [Altericista sp. CCNU0014]|uniref:phytanoyl-CoA dioxygenase family protein n=1 Tax=Altericista sp. CCNU0014 TaxID=3082949 RepID=UPI00384B3EDA